MVKKKAGLKRVSPEERGRGSMDKYAALGLIHKIVRPRLYLEIGVQKGASLVLARGRAIGVDPRPLVGKLPARFQVFPMASLDFFTRHAESVLQGRELDLVFIDGMHLIENVLDDFCHVERWSHSGTVVVVDDVLPAHPAQAERVRRTVKWTGDVWKLPLVLREHRKDLAVTLIDAAPTGLMLITGLGKGCADLPDNYPASSLGGDAVPPPAVLDREGVSNDPATAIRQALAGRGVA